MAKKPALTTLTFRDLVLGSDAETLRQALEARVRIDELIAERQAAYERIAALENQIEDVIGEPGVFPFPPPPLPVAGIDPKADSLLRSSSAGAASGKRVAKAAAPAPAPAPAPEQSDETEADEPAEPEAVDADEANDNDESTEA